jgi:hypothetical protein
MVQGTAESGKGLVETNESATTADAGFHAYCESACFDETMGHRSESGYLSGPGTYAWDQTPTPIEIDKFERICGKANLRSCCSYGPLRLCCGRERLGTINHPLGKDGSISWRLTPGDGPMIQPIRALFAYIFVRHAVG